MMRSRSHSKWGTESQFAPRSVTAELLLWTTAVIYLCQADKEQRKQKSSPPSPLSLHSSSLGEGNHSPGHPTDPTEGAPHWRSQSRAAGRGKWGVLDGWCRQPWPLEVVKSRLWAICLYGSLSAYDGITDFWPACAYQADMQPSSPEPKTQPGQPSLLKTTSHQERP